MPKFGDTPMVEGPIGLVSQSGGLGYVVLQAMERGIGFSTFLSAGNSCDVDVARILLIISSTTKRPKSSPACWRASATACASWKPVIVRLRPASLCWSTKMGNSVISGVRAVAYRHARRQCDGLPRGIRTCGMVAIDNWEELLETARLFRGIGQTVRTRRGHHGELEERRGNGHLTRRKNAVSIFPLPAEMTSERMARHSLVRFECESFRHHHRVAQGQRYVRGVHPRVRR
ncbi:MAG: hypothetical protein KIT18_09520 [Burkholderiales bacterium]|nr:hypothetical protein [Burkholderiales bacterium]